MKPIEKLGCGCIIDSLDKLCPCYQHRSDPARVQSTESTQSIGSATLLPSSLEGRGSGTEQADAVTLLRQLVQPCEGTTEHSWRACKRCTAMHGLENRFSLTMRLLQAAIDALASPVPLPAAAPARWRDMGSAPRPASGRRKVIDVWCITDDHESAKFYFGNTMCGVKDQMMWQGRVSEVYWLDGAWRPASGLRMHGLTVTPIAWMPLPAPPSSSSPAKDGA